MKYKKKFLITTSLFFLLCQPALAQYVPAIKIPGGQASYENPSLYFLDLYNFIMGAATIMAIVIMMWGGFLWLTARGNAAQVKTAKEYMSGAVIGVVLMLNIYMLLYLLNPQLTVLKWPEFNQITTGTASTQTTTTAETPYYELSARRALEGTGVTVKNACPPGTNTNCVNLSGIKPSTLQAIIDLKTTICPDAFVNITGGTEDGHASGEYSHDNGYKVDLSVSNSTDKCIISSGNFTKVGTRTGDHGGDMYQSKDGSACYVREGNHWDVSVIPGTGCGR